MTSLNSLMSSPPCWKVPSATCNYLDAQSHRDVADTSLLLLTKTTTISAGHLMIRPRIVNFLARSQDWPIVVTSAASYLLFLTDSNSSHCFLIDTGAKDSVIPPSPAECRNKLVLEYDLNGQDAYKNILMYKIVQITFT